MSLINIGLSGLNASSAAINTIGNNTANVDTAGYSRQQVHTQASPQILLGLGVGYIGTGTTISDVRRIYDGFLETQLQTSTGLNAEAVAYSTQASKTDSLLSDSTTGIAAQLSSFFTKLQGVAANGTQSSDRSAFLAQASSLAGRMNSIAAQLSAQSSNINTQFSTLAENVNKLTTTIAGLNKQIVQDSVANTSPNTLLDARNEAVRQLNELVGARVVENGNNYDIYIGNGQALVSGSTASKLEAVPGNTDATQFTLQVKTGGVVTDVSSVVTGGAIGGLLRYRNEVLTPAVNEVSRVAMVLSDKINTQLVTGINQKGAFGTPLFSDINSATAITHRSVGKDGNSAGSGNLNVTITDTSKLTADDYEVKVDVSNPGAVPPTTTFTVRRLPEGAVVGTGDLYADPAPSFDGFSLSLSGNNLAAGDTFKVTPTRNGAAGLSVVMTDAQDLAAAAPLAASAGVSNSGTGAFTQPTLTSMPNIYDAAGVSALQAALKDATPMRLVMGAASNGVQSYTLVNAQGQPVVDKNNQPVGGNLLQGQNNTLKFNVGYGTVPGDTSFEFEMTVYGTPNANDTFNISLTAAGSSDNRNAAAIVDLQTARTVGVTNGSAGFSLSGAYGNLVSETGTRAAQGKSDVTATNAVLAQAKSARDSVSGVSLDEEAASLIKYQQYYTASSQIIKAAQTMFSTLINSL